MYSEIVSLFHRPTIVKVLGIVGLSYRLPCAYNKCKKVETLVGRDV